MVLKYLMILCICAIVAISIYMLRINSDLTSILSDIVSLDKFKHQSTHNKTIDQTLSVKYDNSCRISFVSCGSYSKYKTHNLAKWLQHSRNDCLIEVIREGNQLISEIITEDERDTFNKLAEIPVSQADFMKLLIMYHLGGVVADFDVLPLRMYPNQWMNYNSTHNCDVFFGLESDCFDQKSCKKRGIKKYGQIQTWTFFTRRTKTRIMKTFIDKVIENYKKFGLKQEIQAISGSYLITDYLIELLGRPHYDIPLDDYGTTLKQSRQGVLVLENFNQLDENLCILGIDWTSGECKGPNCLLTHEFEGTWK